MADDDIKPIARNRRARHEYDVIETHEAGLVLKGPEVKSLREGRASLAEAFATVRRGEVYLHKLHIPPYEPATRANQDPIRERKLLLHKREIAKLGSQVAEQGLTLVPLSLYFKDGRAKIELALVRGRRRYDKRQELRRRDDERETRRAVRGRGRGGPRR